MTTQQPSNGREPLSWAGATLKAIVIFVAVAALTVFIPSWVLRLDQVTGLDRDAQDLIGSVVWGAGFLGSLWLLWYAHKHRRI